MPWFAPSESTIKTRISGPEFEALKGAALASGQTPATLIPAVTASIVQQIRGYVAKRYPLGLAGTIPDELTSAFGSLWVHEFISRIPRSDKLLTDPRVKAYDDANRQLREVSSGTFVIVPPEEAAPSNQQGGGPGFTLVNAGQRENTSAMINGSGLI